MFIPNVFIYLTIILLICLQTCRCHGIPLDKSIENLNDSPLTCPVTGHFLGEVGLIENSVKVGESTILFMPSFQCCQKLQQINLPIDFNIVERTNLQTLNEGSLKKILSCFPPQNTYQCFEFL